MTTKTIVLAHLFHGRQILLGFGNDSWDSFSGTLKDGENFKEALERCLIEKVGLVPENLQMLGTTRGGHGFFYGRLVDVERLFVDVKRFDGQRLKWFNLGELSRLKLGGTIRNHWEFSPRSFEDMACDEIPAPSKLQLRVPMLMR
ncbi:MAG: NUDIX hydrolase [Parcubacteria group bacterium]